MNKFLILTAVTNEKDILRDPIVKFDNCDYIAFTDKKYNVESWEQRNIHLFSNIDNFKNRRNAKIYKILATMFFPDYEYIIWVDANRELVINPETLLIEYGNNFDLLLFRHGGRKCYLEEIEAVKKYGYLEDENILEEQKRYYIETGMPEKFGLFEMPTFIRKNTETTKLFEIMWWEQICKFSSRDQISLPYVLWKLSDKIEIKVFKGFTIKRNKIGNMYFIKNSEHNKIG